jgi:hypothetical protein
VSPAQALPDVVIGESSAGTDRINLVGRFGSAGAPAYDDRRKKHDEGVN